jgi:8-oxo-dGTP pyrophosphatase MutT (NUDIX family)
MASEAAGPSDAEGAPVQAAAAYRIAALREAFEETGFLLACRADGGPLPLAQLGSARLAALRARSRADAAAFRAILVEEGWRLAAGRTAYYARWITPEERPLRYDARFFLALALPGASEAGIEPDGRETVACRWVRPAAALEEARSGPAPLPVPTREVLRSLIEATDTTSLLMAVRRREVRPVRPRIVREDGRERILLPGEPGYY